MHLRPIDEKAGEGKILKRILCGPTGALCLVLVVLITARPSRADVIFYDPKEYGPDVPLGEIEAARGRLRGGKIVDARVEVWKHSHQLFLYSGETLLKIYRIQVGSNFPQAKDRAGDKATPEGVYRICEHRRRTDYHRAMAIDYPNREDLRRGLEAGILTEAEGWGLRRAMNRHQCPPIDSPLGGNILIHGQPGEQEDIDPRSLLRSADWTEGCIALTNPDIREIYDALPDGTRVMINW